MASEGGFAFGRSFTGRGAFSRRNSNNRCNHRRRTYPYFYIKKKRRPRAIVKRRVSQRGDDRSCSRISSLSRLACAGGRYGIQLARGVIVAKTIAIGGKGHLAVSLGNRALATTRGDETFFVRGNTLAVRSDNDANIVRNDKAIANGNNTV